MGCWKRGFALQGQHAQKRNGQHTLQGMQQFPNHDRKAGQQYFSLVMPPSLSSYTSFLLLAPSFPFLALIFFSNSRSTVSRSPCILGDSTASKLWIWLTFILESSMLDFMAEYTMIQHMDVKWNDFIIVIMDHHLIQTLDYDQHFQEVEIDAGKEVERLKGVTFQQTMDRLQERLNEMAESQFYKSITVHFGAKSKQQLSYLEEHYERREELLRLELEKEKEYLRNIVEAKDEDQLTIREQEHKLHHLVVQKRREEVRDPQDFIPCLYIQAVKKNWLYGSINQTFDRNGVGSFSAKLGWRSPFRKYDSLELNFEKPLTTNFKVRYYQAGLEWSNPLRGFGNSYVHLKSAEEYIFKGIDNRLASLGCALQKGKDKFQADLSFRQPSIREDVASHVLDNFHLPSRKFSLKHSRVFKNTVKFQDITEGEYSELKTQAAIPFLGNSKFLKMEYHYRKFFDTFKVRNYLDNDLARKFFWKSTLQANFSATVLKEFGQNRYVNDVLQSMDVRGFENNKKPTPSYANLKTSLKFNIHNFPVLQDARVGTFLYAQAGLSFLKANPYRPYFTAATGLGLSFSVGPYAQIQLLLNAAQYQSRPMKQPISFQVRFGLFD